MKFRAITFDCAQTLIRVDYNPAAIALESVKAVGLTVDEPVAASLYGRMLASRWGEYQLLNQLRSQEKCDEFWRCLTRDWCAELGLGESPVDGLLAAADELLFGPNSRVFTLYDDVIPALESLRDKGYRMGVLSNWDVTLHKALAMHGLTEYFEVRIASLEEGVEKPDPALFQIALDALDVEAAEAIHVGDNPLDDFEGARRAGMKAFLLDRDAPVSEGPILRSLLDLGPSIE